MKKIIFATLGLGLLSASCSYGMEGAEFWMAVFKKQGKKELEGSSEHLNKELKKLDGEYKGLKRLFIDL